jgi:inositol-phosphate phosphatase / L-galactose 1-phosphate phosphatase / histidinol-phosphatase
MSEPSLSSFVPLLHRLADAAGEVIRPYFRNVAFETKEDASPVTLADQGAEKAIRAVLEKERPQDGVWGEEFGASNMDAEFAWVIDPIDGTKAFMRGMPAFATLIGLLQNGKPVLGVIDQPVSRERWLGGGHIPTTFNNRPVKTRKCASLSKAVMNSSSSDCSLVKTEGWKKTEALAANCQYAALGGDAYVYGLVASGFVDVVADAGLKLHDYAALAPVIEGAGGHVCDWQGQPLNVKSGDKVLAVGDKALLEPALSYLKNQ